MPKKRSPCRQFIPIGSVLDKVVRQYQPMLDHSLLQVWEIWDQAVGSAIARQTRPAAFKDRTLLIHVSNSTWLHQLRFMEKEIISKLNDTLGVPLVGVLKLKIGPV